MTKKTYNASYQRKGIGKKSALLLSMLAEKNKNLFTIDDAISILHENRPALIKLLYDLTKKGWLQRLTKGKYLILPLEAGANPAFTEHEFIIASALIKPYYISYWSALHYYGLTEQVSKTIFIATIKRKREITIHGLTFKFITLTKKKFFGFTKRLINNQEINLAEREKGIIDCIDQPRNCGGMSEISKAIENANDELNIKKLIAYAKKMKNAAILNRLGYLSEILKKPLKIKPSRHYVLLDPLNKNKGGYNKKWMVRENISKEELLSW